MNLRSKPGVLREEHDDRRAENFKIDFSIIRVYINEEEYKRTHLLSKGFNVISR
jgi:hypothetical protein